MSEISVITCEHCIFFRDSEGQNGACWRYPPTGFPMLAPEPGTIQVEGKPSQGLAILAIRPPVNAGTFACGEYDDGAPDSIDGPGGTD